MSRASGTAALLDGSTGDRVARVQVAKPGDVADVVQTNFGGLVVNKTAGTLSRLDGATWSTGSPVSVGSPNDKNMAVFASDTSVWSLSQAGLVLQELDPDSLLPSAPASTVGKHTKSAVVDSSGSLWVLREGGGVRSYRNGTVVSSQLPTSADAQLVLAGDRPVVVDSTRGAATVLDPGSAKPSREVCLDVSQGSEPAFAVSSGRQPWILTVDSRSATLVVSHVDTGRCDPIVLGGATSTDRYGAPVEKDGLVYVPRLNDGIVTVVDPQRHGSDRIVRRISLGVTGDSLRLLSNNGHVWFDDVIGDLAGVITDDFRAIPASKGADSGKGTLPNDGLNNDSNNRSKAGDSQQGGTNSKNGSDGRNSKSSGATSDEGVESSGGTSDEDGSANDGSTAMTIFGQSADSIPPTLVAGVVVDFTVSPATQMTNHRVILTNTTKGTIKSRAWTFKNDPAPTILDGDPNKSDRLTLSWPKKGKYSVVLTVDTDQGARAKELQVVVTTDATVPVLRGLTTQDARDALVRSGFDVNNILVGPAQNSIMPTGRILSSLPDAGNVSPDGRVVITPSNGDGVITTRASGLTDAADLAADDNGTLFAIQQGAARVVSITGGSATTILTPLSGQPIFCFDAPECGGVFARLAVTSTNDLYVTSYGVKDFMRFNPGDGSLFWSLFDPKWGSPVIGATADSNGTLYGYTYAHDNNGYLFSYSDSTNERSIGTYGRLDDLQKRASPVGLAVDGNHNIFFAPHGGNVIRKVTGPDSSQVIAGTGAAAYGGDGGPAAAAGLTDVPSMVVDRWNNLYFIDAGNHRIRMIDPAGNIHRIAGDGADMARGDRAPASASSVAVTGNSGLAFDSSGALCFTEPSQVRCIS